MLARPCLCALSLTLSRKRERGRCGTARRNCCATLRFGDSIMADDGKSRLGRGLAALIGDVGEETKVVERSRHARKLPIEFIRPNPRNPRRTFSDVELDELASSIQERGI